MKTKKLILVSSIAFLLISLVSCGHITERRPSHNSESVVYSNSKFQWAEVDYQTFLKGAQRAPFQTGSPVLADSPLGGRMQYWADQLHAKIKQDFESKNPVRRLRLTDNRPRQSRASKVQRNYGG